MDQDIQLQCLALESAPGEFSDADKLKHLQTLIASLSDIDLSQTDAILFVSLPKNRDGGDIDVRWAGSGQDREELIGSAIESHENIVERLG